MGFSARQRKDGFSVCMLRLESRKQSGVGKKTSKEGQPKWLVKLNKKIKFMIVI